MQKFTPEQQVSIVEKYVVGWSLQRLAEAYNCSSRTPIRRVLACSEVVRRGRGELLRAVVKNGKKRCSRCGRWKLIKAFYHSVNHSTGHTPACRICMNKLLDIQFEQRLVKRFGISIEEYQQLYVNQNGCCAICGQPEQQRKYGKLTRLCLDHDHITKQCRGLLCHKCNRLLGQAEDLPERLLAAAIYLQCFKGPRKGLK